MVTERRKGRPVVFENNESIDSHPAKLKDNGRDKAPGLEACCQTRDALATVVSQDHLG